MLNRILCLIIGYAFGLIQTGYFYGKANGIDIREHGSGNSGATNTLRVLGTKAGLTVLLGDALKCILAVVLTHFLFAINSPDLNALFKLYTALGVILGHNFPFYLKFKGGKGIAATAGLIICMGPIYFFVELVVFFLPFLLTHFVSLGSLLVYGCFMILTVILGQIGYFGCSNAILIEMYIVTFILTVLAYVRHRKNILRLVHKEESPVFLSKKSKEKYNQKHNID